MPETRPRDDGWFETLYKRCQNPVARWITRATANSDVADDLTDETFLRAWEFRDRVPDDDDEALYYVLGIARNITNDHLKKVGKLRRAVTMSEGELVQLSNKDFTAKVADQLDVARALLRLGPADRDLLWRSICDGVANADLARELHVSVDALHKRLERARKRLKKQLRRNNVVDGRPIQVRGQ